MPKETDPCADGCARGCPHDRVTRRYPLKPLSEWTPEEVYADPSASDWIKGAIRSLLLRDPVDAMNDAEALAVVVRSECMRRMKGGF